RNGHGWLHRMVRPAYRSSFRIISFSPDQTSSTAQTFISTSPSGKAIWRTTSSVTSVATPELFFGQDTHIIPAGSIANRIDSSLAFNVDLDDANKCIKVTPLLTRFAHFTECSAGSCSSARYFSDTPSTYAVIPSLYPSFFQRGVPEYPATNFGLTRWRIATTSVEQHYGGSARA